MMRPRYAREYRVSVTTHAAQRYAERVTPAHCKEIAALVQRGLSQQAVIPCERGKLRVSLGGVQAVLAITAIGYDVVTVVKV